MGMNSSFKSHLSHLKYVSGLPEGANQSLIYLRIYFHWTNKPYSAQQRQRKDSNYR